ncbi:MAG: hypothetical protein A3E78_16545 [Alphaproteobacteria bacterium RIFCSPHIGHO2_12_FULL_63_12]|nr:MAG: hypothetical protein A3E78_16545 [Alphaproteobacteria bacterium RIFCSPHIGHO2_12_FULL_63_12]
MTENAQIREFAGSLAGDCDIDSTCVLIADKSAAKTNLYFLGNFGVSEEILSQYRDHGICDRDPFTDVDRIETGIGAARGFTAASHPEIAMSGARAADYWRFVSDADIEVIGAATTRLLPRVYLTIGVHRDRRAQRRKGVPYEKLAFAVERLQGLIASELLSSLLSHQAGHAAFLKAMGADDKSAAAPEAVELTRRETQITRLVCAGKQNKEIAYIAGISLYTVENHLRRIYRKFSIHNRAALVARASGAFV